MSADPLVSIVIPTLNRPLFAAEAIASAFAQENVRFEVVVSINDYKESDDVIVERWKNDPRLRVLRHAGRLISMADNWNEGVYAAKGEFFFLLSDDDLLSPLAASTLLSAIQAAESSLEGSCACAWCPVQIIDDDGNYMWTTHSHSGVEQPGLFLESFFRGRRGAMMSSILHRRAEFVNSGGFNGSRYGVLCDVGFWARAATRHNFVVAVQQPMVKYRLSHTSTTSRQSCDEWVARATTLLDDIAKDFETAGSIREATKVRSVKQVCVANHVITILMQRVGRPGWVTEWCSAIWHYRYYFFCRDVMMRAVRDGKKVFWLLANRLIENPSSHRRVDKS